jgi:hypothetical protein
MHQEEIAFQQQIEQDSIKFKTKLITELKQQSSKFQRDLM